MPSYQVCTYWMCSHASLPLEDPCVSTCIPVGAQCVCIRVWDMPSVCACAHSASWRAGVKQAAPLCAGVCAEEDVLLPLGFHQHRDALESVCVARCVCACVCKWWHYRGIPEIPKGRGRRAIREPVFCIRAPPSHCMYHPQP